MLTPLPRLPTLFSHQCPSIMKASLSPTVKPPFQNPVLRCLINECNVLAEGQSSYALRLFVLLPIDLQGPPNLARPHLFVLPMSLV